MSLDDAQFFSFLALIGLGISVAGLIGALLPPPDPKPSAKSD